MYALITMLEVFRRARGGYLITRKSGLGFADYLLYLVLNSALQSRSYVL